VVKDERGHLLVDPQKMLNRWKNYFCQLLNEHGVDGVRQTEMHAAEPYVPGPSASEVEVAVGKLKRYKSPGVDQIPGKLAGLIKMCVSETYSTLCVGKNLCYKLPI
jgi:hypothetical protein